MTIRNDSTRPAARLSDGRRARSVVARQGQVLLDVDLNEEAAAVDERIEVEATDTLGTLAIPFHAPGFAIGPGGKIGKGRLYLDGLLVENLVACTLATQPHPAEAVPAGGALVALKALVRLIDPVEDRPLADKGFGDAAGSGRGYVDWQVFPVPLPSGGAGATCSTVVPDWDKLIAPSSGRLAARTNPGTAAPNFCSPAVSGGFTRLENLHYRVEVDGGVPVSGYPDVDGPRFGLAGLRLKFSRRNASVMARITDYNGRTLQVDPPVLDAGQWFAPGTAAEIVSIDDDVDPTQAVAQTRLFTVAQASGDQVTLGAGGSLPLPAVADLGTDWYLRLWDCLPDFTISATTVLASGGLASTEIDLGDGIGITLHNAASGDTLFRRGDYWSFTARVDGTIDWPETAPGVPTPRMPDGPKIHYARLAVASGPAAQPTDCRPIVLPLAEQSTLLYAGGDGQAGFLGDSAAAFVPLRAPLRVLVIRGGLPVAGAHVTWSIPAGFGNVHLNGVAATIDTLTDASGITEIAMALDRAQPDQLFLAEATLVIPASQPPAAPLRFAASFDTAARTSYQPGDCKLLGTAHTVQEALDILCRNTGGPDTLLLTQIQLIGLGAKGNLIGTGIIDNGVEIKPEDLVRGIKFTVDRGPLMAKVMPFDPIVDVELELPYPTTAPDVQFWRNAQDAKDVMPFGTQRLRLIGNVSLDGKEIFWTPSDSAAQFLTLWKRHKFGVGEAQLAEIDQAIRILGRLRLRSQFIWIEKQEKGKPSSKNAERIYLNAEHLGIATKSNGRALSPQDRDPQRAGDLDMFFYLTAPIRSG